MAQPPLPAGARLGVDVRCGLLIKEGKTMRPDERKGLLRVLRVRSLLVAALLPVETFRERRSRQPSPTTLQRRRLRVSQACLEAIGVVLAAAASGTL